MNLPETPEAVALGLVLLALHLGAKPPDGGVERWLLDLYGQSLDAATGRRCARDGERLH